MLKKISPLSIFRMTSPRVQFFLLLTFYCSGFLAYGGPSATNAIKMDLEISNGLPFTKITIGSRRYRLMLSTWFPDILLFSKSGCKTKLTMSKDNKNGKHNSVTKADVQMCLNIQSYDDVERWGKKTKSSGTFEVPYLDGKLKGYYTTENMEDFQEKQSWMANFPSIQDVQEGFQALLSFAGVPQKTQGTGVAKKATELNYKIGIMTDWPSELSNINHVGKFDGFFGLMCLPKGNSDNISPLFKFLTDSKNINSRHFGIYFNFARGSGELMLGGINPSYINCLKNVPVVPDGKGWLINIDSIKVGSDELDTNLKAYVDTSTTSFYGKADIILKINTALGAKEENPGDDYDDSGESEEEKLWVFPSCQHNPPDLILTISGQEYTLDSSTTVERTYNILCQPAFNIAELEDYDLILGSYFLNKYYTVFDEGSRMIRFAETSAIRRRHKGQKQKNTEGKP